MGTSGSLSQVLIGQLTDMHVLAADHTQVDAEVWVDNNERLRRAVDLILDEPHALMAIVATGDLTNDGRPEEYDALLDLVAPIAERLLPLPGNHDRPDEVRRRFPHVPWADTDHVSWVTTVAGIRLIGLDSTRTLHGAMVHGGGVDDAQISWLDSILATPHDGPTVLAMHHPPFASGIWWMDQYGFDGVEELHDVLADRRVERIMCGHLHRPMTSMFAGAVAQVGMSTVQHVGPDFGSTEHVTVVTDPVGYQVLQVRSHDVYGGIGTGPRVVMHHRFIDPAFTPVVPVWAEEFRASANGGT